MVPQQKMLYDSRAFKVRKYSKKALVLVLPILSPGGNRTEGQCNPLQQPELSECVPVGSGRVPNEKVADLTA